MITSLITIRNRYFIANKRRLIRANVKRIENSLQNYRYFCLDVQTILQYVLQACAITDCADTFDRERARSRSLGEETSMKANSDKSKQSNKATRRVLAGVLCGASVLSLVLSLVMPPISQAIANDVHTVSAEETVMGGGFLK